MSDEASVLLTILVAHTFLAGIAGTFGRMYIASFLLSTESIRSPSPLRRFGYRYLVFGLHYLISFMFSPVLFGPFLKTAGITRLSMDVKPFVYFALCTPLAMVLYAIDCWTIVRCDPLKISVRAGRIRFR